MGDAADVEKPCSSSAKPKPDFNERFRKLHQLRQQCRKANHEQVVEEDRKKKLPANYEAKKARDEWELEEMEAKKSTEAAVGITQKLTCIVRRPLEPNLLKEPALR
ncbi:hypothetical protein ANCDUO_24447 [Ancylostoma duodenale]|uniref:Uncharacterized protein n=1 Tax=Ancylostoma duodenale TaxID=51022 RepID=A0A0C2C792_9BILA|nr:hypothetical protein ANCDUO_24447 [Ancylostoma duodenale]